MGWMALLKWVSCEYSTRKQLLCTSTSTVWSCAPALRVHLQYHTSTHTCKHIHTHIHTHTHTHTHAHTYIPTCTLIHTNPYMYVLTHTHTCPPTSHIYIHTYTPHAHSVALLTGRSSSGSCWTSGGPFLCSWQRTMNIMSIYPKLSHIHTHTRTCTLLSPIHTHIHITHIK